MKQVFSSFLELIGLALIAAGLWMLAPWLGVAVAGVLVVAVGTAVGRDVVAPPDPGKPE